MAIRMPPRSGRDDLPAYRIAFEVCDEGGGELEREDFEDELVP
jgi:hypothetical protein